MQLAVEIRDSSGRAIWYAPEGLGWLVTHLVLPPHGVAEQSYHWNGVVHSTGGTKDVPNGVYSVYGVMGTMRRVLSRPVTLTVTNQRR
jgi:hypothetical protein